jgi:hypothetical protein
LFYVFDTAFIDVKIDISLTSDGLLPWLIIKANERVSDFNNGVHLSSFFRIVVESSGLIY